MPPSNTSLRDELIVNFGSLTLLLVLVGLVGRDLQPADTKDYLLLFLGVVAFSTATRWLLRRLLRSQRARSARRNKPH
ncbi:MAG: hypothetical protein SV583_09225 [Pseudomonadota bacterium]|nr:hypothetical protein [Pseudomonadota bacterium]